MHVAAYIHRNYIFSIRCSFAWQQQIDAMFSILKAFEKLFHRYVQASINVKRVSPADKKKINNVKNKKEGLFQVQGFVGLLNAGFFVFHFKHGTDRINVFWNDN